MSRITKLVDTDTMTLEGVWQMVPSQNLHKLGLDDPIFVSARVTVDKNPTTYATWTVQNVKAGPVIPLDGSAQAGTKSQQGIDPPKYSDLVTNKYYEGSRSCAQAAFGLQQQKKQERKGG